MLFVVGRTHPHFFGLLPIFAEEMWTSTLWLACVSLLFGTSLSCYYCFIDNTDSARLCWGHILDEVGVRNVDACFRKLDRIFNNNEEVIEAGSVGGVTFFSLMYLFYVLEILLYKASSNNWIQKANQILMTAYVGVYSEHVGLYPCDMCPLQRCRLWQTAGRNSECRDSSHSTGFRQKEEYRYGNTCSDGHITVQANEPLELHNC